MEKKCAYDTLDRQQMNLPESSTSDACSEPLLCKKKLSSTGFVVYTFFPELQHSVSEYFSIVTNRDDSSLPHSNLLFSDLNRGRNAFTRESKSSKPAPQKTNELYAFVYYTYLYRKDASHLRKKLCYPWMKQYYGKAQNIVKGLVKKLSDHAHVLRHDTLLSSTGSRSTNGNIGYSQNGLLFFEQVSFHTLSAGHMFYNFFKCTDQF